jgi:hypothetical protein
VWDKGASSLRVSMGMPPRRGGGQRRSRRRGPARDGRGPRRPAVGSPPDARLFVTIYDRILLHLQRCAAYPVRVGSPARASAAALRSSRPHPTSSVSGRGRRALGSGAPPVKMGRRPRSPDGGPPPAPDRSIVGRPRGHGPARRPRQRPPGVGRLRPRRGSPDAPGPADGRPSARHDLGYEHPEVLAGLRAEPARRGTELVRSEPAFSVK